MIQGYPASRIWERQNMRGQWTNLPEHRLGAKVAAAGEFSPTVVTMGHGIMGVICVMLFIQPQSRKPLAKAGIVEALCCSLFWQRDRGEQGCSCSESHSLSHKMWKHEDELVCRSWCSACVSVRHLWIKENSFQHCSFSTLPTSNTMTGVVLN